MDVQESARTRELEKEIDLVHKCRRKKGRWSDNEAIESFIANQEREVANKIS